MRPSTGPSQKSGFTLIELLTVIAIIGILVAILIPSVSAVRVSANKARTKVKFAQWTAAIESFRNEYGYYPAFDTSGLVNGGAAATVAGEHPFHDLLAGRRRDGLPVAADSTAAAQNRRRIAFMAFGEGDFTPAHLLQDAFGQTSLAVLVDRNLDGAIRIGGAAADYATLPAVRSADGGAITPTSGTDAADFPSSGIKAGVIFYGAAPSATTGAPEFIFSWK